MACFKAHSWPALGAGLGFFVVCSKKRFKGLFGWIKNLDCFKGLFGQFYG